MNYSESDKFYLSYDLQLFAQEGSNGDKTEEPTAKKLEDARKKGQAARSTDVTGATGMLSTAIATIIAMRIAAAIGALWSRVTF